MHRMDKAKESIDAVQGLLDKEDSTHAEIRELGDSLKAKCDELREEFTGPSDIQGFIQTPNTVMSKLDDAVWALASYWGAPTPSQMLYLQHAEARLQEVLDRVNQLLDADYAEFRRRAGALNLTVIKEVESLSIDWKP
jgi:hypothetical protein